MVPLGEGAPLQFDILRSVEKELLSWVEIVVQSSIALA
jgi:hypothetical protein